jgi:putrescine aminotransferase
MTTPSREQILDLAERYVCPNRVRTLQMLGVDLVVGRREGYHLWDVDGREYLDLHINGGVFNLGHCNPELVAVLVESLQTLDIGNHHFPSVERALLAEQLVGLTPGAHYAVFASGGGEAVDLALKSARRATGRRRVVSVTGAYHGHTGLSLAAGDERAAESFLSEGSPGEFIRVPFDDLEALERELAAGDIAAVVLETLPATVGFPIPAPDYLPGVRTLCDAAGSLYIADEVQTGLGRTGSLWAVERAEVVPDVLVCGKGLSGGLYPIAATLLSERAGHWLEEDGWAHVSTFGGAEVGCRVGRAVLDVTTRATTRDRVECLIARFTVGLKKLALRHPDRLLEVRQTGLVIGLRFGHPQGGMLMTKALYDIGLWAMFAGFDPATLQLKPGLLMDDATADEVLVRLDQAIATLPAGPVS